MQVQGPDPLSQETYDGPGEEEREQDNSKKAVAAVSSAAEDALVAPPGRITTHTMSTL